MRIGRPKQPLILAEEEHDRLESLARRANEDTQLRVLRVRADCSPKSRPWSSRPAITRLCSPWRSRCILLVAVAFLQIACQECRHIVKTFQRYRTEELPIPFEPDN